MLIPMYQNQNLISYSALSNYCLHSTSGI